MRKANNRIYHWYCYLNQKFEPIEGLTFTHIKYSRMTDQEKLYTKLLNDKKNVYISTAGISQLYTREI